MIDHVREHFQGALGRQAYEEADMANQFELLNPEVPRVIDLAGDSDGEI